MPVEGPILQLRSTEILGGAERRFPPADVHNLRVYINTNAPYVKPMIEFKLPNPTIVHPAQTHIMVNLN